MPLGMYLLTQSCPTTLASFMGKILNQSKCASFSAVEKSGRDQLGEHKMRKGRSFIGGSDNKKWILFSRSHYKNTNKFADLKATLNVI